MEQVGWPCADLHVGDELVVSADASEAAWAKLQTSGDSCTASNGAQHSSFKIRVNSGCHDDGNETH